MSMLLYISCIAAEVPVCPEVQCEWISKAVSLDAPMSSWRGGHRGYERYRMSHKEQRSKTSPWGFCGCVRLKRQSMSCVCHLTPPAWASSDQKLLQHQSQQKPSRGCWERLGDWEISAWWAGRAMRFMALFGVCCVLQRWRNVQNSCLLSQLAAWGDGGWGKKQWENIY